MLIEEVKNNLTNTIIPFWKKLRDNSYGGYYGMVDFDLTVNQKSEKGCILNSRILWFFSNAYIVLNDESLLDEAKHAYDFLKNNCLDKENGGVYWAFDYKGRVLESMKHTYNQAFALYALSSYYDASGCEEALAQTWSLYNLIEEKCRDDNGYIEAFDKEFNPITNEKLSENEILAERTMNTLLHLLEAYTEFYRVTGADTIKKDLKYIMDLIETKIYNPEKGRQEVFFDKDWNSLLDLQSYGHDIESAWLIDRGCEILGDDFYINKMSHITKRLTETIFERAYKKNSVLNECENGVDNTRRIWWVQAEAMVGFLNGYEKNPSKKEYLTAVNDIWDYIKLNLLDKREDSEWFWEVDDNGEPVSRKPIVEPWKCPYHNGRMCLELLRRRKLKEIHFHPTYLSLFSF